MKKLLSLILALAMVACMSVTAFAADGTTVLTAEIPDNIPTYTFHCEASVTLEYGNTEKQTVGDYYVTDVSDNIESIFCQPTYTDLINTAEPTDTISLVLFDDYGTGTQVEVSKDGNVNNSITLQLYMEGVDNIFYTNGYRTRTLKAQVSDWSGATAGATYQATITYVVVIPS